MAENPRNLVSSEIVTLQNIQIEPSSRLISSGETMAFDAAHPELYFFHGKSAMRVVFGTLALLGRDRSSVSSILDFACGHGRVTRYFRSSFPAASIVVSDVDGAGVTFCATTFEAEPHISASVEIEAINFHRQFDLIWVGSLLTHVDVEDWHRFMRLWRRSLNPGGILIFTYASSYVRYLAQGGEFANLDQSALTRAVSSFDDTGFGYLPYTPNGTFGQTFATEQWVSNFLGQYPALRSVLHFERGWGARQNVVAVTLDEVAEIIGDGVP
ncbi:MAG: class I SAM-dependent methyltransferase [Micropepsaceae bacterium]